MRDYIFYASPLNTVPNSLSREWVKASRLVATLTFDQSNKLLIPG